MQISIHERGVALTADGVTYRLKDLLPADALQRGRSRLRAADPVGPNAIKLTLSGGEEHHAPLPVAESSAPAPDSDGPPDLIIRNATQVLTMQGEGVGLVEDAAVACRAGRILGVYGAAALEQLLVEAPGCQLIDAGGGVVTPGLVEPHAHPVFGGERSVEFGMKAEGRSYLDIHKAGGGIFATVRSTRSASFEELLRGCIRNLDRLLSWGVTTTEGKSGYALEVEGELRMLEVLWSANAAHPVDVEPTLLGAHAVPEEHRDNREAYVAAVAERMVPESARRGLARHCDAYCEDGAFTPSEVERVFEAARRHGLALHLHAEQFSDQGGAALAARLGALSADHLEEVSEEGIAALAASGTVAVLLPGAALTCRCPWPPARRLIEAGVPVALGTDLNPGSSMTASLPLMMSLACMQMGMSCEAAWRAVTRIAARSLGRADVGHLAPGARADIVIFDAPDYRYVPYHYGDNHARVVIKGGRVVLKREAG